MALELIAKFLDGISLLVHGQKHQRGHCANATHKKVQIVIDLDFSISTFDETNSKRTTKYVNSERDACEKNPEHALI